MPHRRMALKEARKMTGLSQRALAKLAGVKHSAISDVEEGRVQKPSFDFVVRIVRALHRRGLEGITAEELFPVPESAEAPEASR